MPKKTLKKAKDSENNVIVQVKENQETLFKNCELEYRNSQPDDVFMGPIEKHHGRLERRNTKVFRSFVPSDPGWYLVEELIVVERIRKVKNTKTKSWEESSEVSFFISTTSQSAKKYTKDIRLHWGTENKNHHVKDRTLLEDDSRIRINPGNFAKLRSFTLNIFRKNKVINVNKTLYENSLDVTKSLSYHGVL